MAATTNKTTTTKSTTTQTRKQQHEERIAKKTSQKKHSEGKDKHIEVRKEGTARREQTTRMTDSIEDSDHNIVNKAVVGDGDDDRKTRQEAR